MFLRSRRDCSKVSVPAKERGIPQAVSANALMSARPATGPRLLYPPRTDIGDGKCDVRFVPIVLQKSQNAVRLIFRQKTNQATTADRCILKRASEVANENGSGFTSIQTKRSKSTIRRV